MGFDIPKHRKAAKKLLPRKRKKKLVFWFVLILKIWKKLVCIKKLKNKNKKEFRVENKNGVL